jgi:hypothetical protein
MRSVLEQSPPLPEGWDPERGISTSTLRNEAHRAMHELLYALMRQRSAWARLAEVKKHYGEQNIDYVDNLRPYKEAVGDVQWWRGEVSSRANALSALAAALTIAHNPHIDSL